MVKYTKSMEESLIEDNFANVQKQTTLLFNLAINKQEDEFCATVNKINKHSLDEVLHNQSLAHVCTKVNGLKMIKCLVNSGGRMDIIDGNGVHPIYYAMNNYYEDMLITILELDKDAIGFSILDLVDKNGLTPLDYSVMNRSIDQLNILIKYGVNIHRSDVNKSIIFLAIKTTWDDGALAIINKMQNVNISKKNGTTPLHYACSTSMYSVCKNLLDKGADVNSQNKNGMTPLHIAILVGNDNICDLLLKYSPDPNIVNHLGMDIMYFSIYHRRINVFKMIWDQYRLRDLREESDKGIDCNKITSLGDTVAFQMIKEFPELQEYYSKILSSTWHYQVDVDRNSLLHILIMRDIWKSYKNILVQQPQNIFLKNKKGLMPYDMVSSEDRESLIDLAARAYYRELWRDPSQWKGWEKKCGDKTMAEEGCLKKIKRHIFDVKSSVPVPDGDVEIILDDHPSITITTFSASFLYNTIGSDMLMTKYPELGMIYNNTNPKSILLWTYYGLVYSNSLINDIMNMSQDKKYIGMLGIISVQNQSVHQFSLLYHVAAGMVEIYESYGGSLEFLYKKLHMELAKFFHKIDPDIKLSYPSLNQASGFQSWDESTLCSTGVMPLDRHPGYCGAWSIWFIDQRMKYLSYDAKTFMGKLIKAVKMSDKHPRAIIRNYSDTIARQTEARLASIGIDIEEMMLWRTVDPHKFFITTIKITKNKIPSIKRAH